MIEVVSLPLNVWLLGWKMKIFETIENHFANIGLTASPSMQSLRFNTKNLIILTLLGVFVLSLCAYLVLTANDFADYITSLYGCSTVISFFSAFANFILQIPNRNEFIVNFKTIIDKSKWNNRWWLFGYHFIFDSPNHSIVLGLQNPKSKSIYDKNDENVQKLLRFLNVVVVIVSPIALTAPIYIASFIKYHFTDLGNDAFVFPFPMWWVENKT